MYVFDYGGEWSYIVQFQSVNMQLDASQQKYFLRTKFSLPKSKCICAEDYEVEAANNQTCEKAFLVSLVSSQFELLSIPAGV